MQEIGLDLEVLWSHHANVRPACLGLYNTSWSNAVSHHNCLGSKRSYQLQLSAFPKTDLKNHSNRGFDEMTSIVARQNGSHHRQAFISRSRPCANPTKFILQNEGLAKMQEIGLDLEVLWIPPCKCQTCLSGPLQYLMKQRCISPQLPWKQTQLPIATFCVPKNRPEKPFQ